MLKWAGFHPGREGHGPLPDPVEVLIMALAKVDSLTRAEVGTFLNSPQTRGLVLEGQQVELILVTKLTGDTTGSVALSNVKRPSAVYVIPTRDLAGANSAALTPATVTFTRTDDSTIALTALASWTVGILLVVGRSYA